MIEEPKVPLKDMTKTDSERIAVLEKEVERLGGVLAAKRDVRVPGIYSVIYQVRRPRTAPIPYGQVELANDYVREQKHALIYALDSGTDVLRVLKANEWLAPGEVVDIIRAQQVTAAGINSGTGGIWQ